MCAKRILICLIVVALFFISNLETALCQYSEIWNSGKIEYQSWGVGWHDANGDNVSDLWIFKKNNEIDIYDGIDFNLIWQLTTTYAYIGCVGWADTDGDEVMEMIFMERSTNPMFVGRIRIYDNVTHLLEWHSEEIEGFNQVCVADINGDGKSEIIINTCNYDKQDSCVVYVYGYAGSGVGEENQGENRPEKSGLSQNYPNPFNPTTTIKYELQTEGIAAITIFNSLGQEVKVLFNGKQQAGEHSIIWDGKNEQGQRVASGVYFYQLKINNYTSSKKMVLLR